MKRLVVGGPERYDKTFVDWPGEHFYWRVPVPKRTSIFHDDPYDIDDYKNNIHIYKLEKVTVNGKLMEVWISTKVNSLSFDFRPYINLLIKPLFRRFYDKTKMKYVYEYFCFGEWHSYWEIANEALYRFAGQEAYSIWLGVVLLKAQQEMRFYKVERVDQTAEIGSGNS